MRLTEEGRDPAQSAAAREKRRVARTEQRRLELAWEADNPGGASADEYRERILPALASITIADVAALMDVSRGYAADVKRGERVPHPRHWEVLQKAQAEPID